MDQNGIGRRSEQQGGSSQSTQAGTAGGLRSFLAGMSEAEALRLVDALANLPSESKRPRRGDMSLSGMAGLHEIQIRNTQVLLDAGFPRSLAK